MHNPKCFARHTGPWLVETQWLSATIAAIKAGTCPTLDAAARGRELDKSLGYTLDDHGIASIGIDGPMMKGDSKYGGTNSVRTRIALRQAVENRAVKAIMLQVDSPGGTVAGTSELARAVADANAAKPVYAHVDGMCASAALWVVSQARKITAEQTAEIGSIGVFAVVEDSSQAAEAAGVKVHVISTGPYKGAFEPGAPVTEQHLAYLQERVDDQNKHFLRAVSIGRGMNLARVKALADGRMFSAHVAKNQGLIDGIGSLEQGYSEIVERVGRLVVS